MDFYMVKKASYLLIVLTGIILVIGSCNRCKDNCGECEIFDSELCECIVDIDCRCNNGKEDGNEDYIDCGGDCPPCECEFDPCLFLTGNDSKVWKYYQTIEEDGDIYQPNACDSSWIYNFSVTRYVRLGCEEGKYPLMRWQFDDNESPTEIVITDLNGNSYQYDLFKLTADTLKLREQIGISTYIAD